MYRIPLRRKLIYLIIAMWSSLALISINYSKGKWFSIKLDSTNGQDVNFRLLNTSNIKDRKETFNRTSKPQNLSIFKLLTPFPSNINSMANLKSKMSSLNLPWFMSGGTFQPTILLDSEVQDPNLKIWPEDATGDRIENQLMLTLSTQIKTKENLGQYPNNTSSSENIKTIFLVGQSYWVKKDGQDTFLRLRCPVSACSFITSNFAERASNADAVLFVEHFKSPKFEKKKDQIWIMYMIESPNHPHPFPQKDIFNWTSSYRSDSDIPDPYGKFVYYNPSIRQINTSVNYAENKTKLVAWFVSNCNDAWNGRIQYAKELGKYIPVDIYGKCGSKSCPKSNSKKCFEMVRREYKFYLAFENSNCREYITEKLFKSGFSNDVVPVVMGAHPDDYKRVAPEHSFIHVDHFDSPEQLAQYLHHLDKNETLYNQYFRWKGTGEMIENNFYMCRLCAMLHAPKRPKYYEDIYKWWSAPDTCIKGSWRELENKKLNNLRR